MKRKKIGIAFMIIGGLMLLAAIIIAVYNISLQKKAEKASVEIVTEIRKMYNLPQMHEEIPQKSEVDMPDFEITTNTELPEAVIQTLENKKTVSIDNCSYIGVLQIIPLEIELPITAEFSYKRLKQTPCRYSGSVESGNLIICAHNYSSHFGGINKLVNGDIIRFISFDNVVRSYTVESIEVIEPTDIEAVNTDEYALTLFTCTLSGEARVVVKCVEA
ncbi:MAG: sortase [Ruminococcus sp.]|nr:sortase [Ruminococcus sp.]MBO5382777.1 sortase [Ruminococcus sp.]MBR6671326.1 sortase [Ruminococcus sp.]